MIPSVAHAHDEMVFIAVAQQGVVGGYVVDEVYGGAGQVDHVDVDEVESAPGAVRAVGPFVPPCATGNHAGVFRAFLPHECDGEFG